MEHWMRNLARGKKLCDVVLPGSHDAGTYGLTMHSPVNPNRTDESTEWAAKAMKFAPCIVVNYSKCQNIDLIEQFNRGVRYYDLRVSKYVPNDYRFTHGILGTDFFRDVGELISHVEQHPSEIVILDIRFIYGFAAQDYEYLNSRLVSSSIAPPQDFTKNSVLGQFWDAKKNIIIVGPNNPQFWPSSRLNQIWPNTTDPQVAMQRMRDSLEYKTSHVLFGLHATLTPDAKYIGWHLYSSTQSLAKKLNNVLVHGGLDEFKGKVSYIMVDVVEHPGLMDAIVAMNLEW